MAQYLIAAGVVYAAYSFSRKKTDFVVDKRAFGKKSLDGSLLTPRKFNPIKDKNFDDKFRDPIAEAEKEAFKKEETLEKDDPENRIRWELLLKKWDIPFNNLIKWNALYDPDFVDFGGSTYGKKPYELLSLNEKLLVLDTNYISGPQASDQEIASFFNADRIAPDLSYRKKSNKGRGGTGPEFIEIIKFDKKMNQSLKNRIVEHEVKIIKQIAEQSNKDDPYRPEPKISKEEADKQLADINQKLSEQSKDKTLKELNDLQKEIDEIKEKEKEFDERQKQIEEAGKTIAKKQEEEKEAQVELDKKIREEKEKEIHNSEQWKALYRKWGLEDKITIIRIKDTDSLDTTKININGGRIFYEYGDGKNKKYEDLTVPQKLVILDNYANKNGPIREDKSASILPDYPGYAKRGIFTSLQLITEKAVQNWVAQYLIKDLYD